VSKPLFRAGQLRLETAGEVLGAVQDLDFYVEESFEK
jgi:hypothetical protein